MTPHQLLGIILWSGFSEPHCAQHRGLQLPLEPERTGDVRADTLLCQDIDIWAV